jgi:hypothetical protein
VHDIEEMRHYDVTLSRKDRSRAQPLIKHGRGSRDAQAPPHRA